MRGRGEERKGKEKLELGTQIEAEAEVEVEIFFSQWTIKTTTTAYKSEMSPKCLPTSIRARNFSTTENRELTWKNWLAVS